MQSNLSLASKFTLQASDLQPLLPETVTTEQTITSNFQYFDIQPKVTLALAQFLQNASAQALVLQSENTSESILLLSHYLKQQYAQAKPFVAAQPDYDIIPQNADWNISLKNNHLATMPVLSALYLEKAQLFGNVIYSPKTAHSDSQCAINAGLLQQVNGGLLLLPVVAFLAEPRLWQRLKSTLMAKRFAWQTSDFNQACPVVVPDFPVRLKVIFVGSREELMHLEALDPTLYQWASYGEIQGLLHITQGDNAQKWCDFVRFVAQKESVLLGIGAEQALYAHLVRKSEDRHWVPLDYTALRRLFGDIRTQAKTNYLTAEHLKHYFQKQAENSSLLREHALDAILQEQIYIATAGVCVGQVNGLSVVEYAGMPQAFGEPVRISCLVQFGDGEVIDVERKTELAGNLHSKGLLIAEACLANVLDLPAQLPFSATVVFEQSYGEIDGDSASLACFLSLISSLAEVPVPQHIAVTGSIDQFGLVHSVGGVNEKIEGFFALCKARNFNLDDNAKNAGAVHGVVIPKVTYHQLSLNDEVIAAVNEGKFAIWAVDDVNEACEVVFGQALVALNPSRRQRRKNPDLVWCIQQRFAQHHEPKGGWFTRLFR